ncbi:hypothetical protein T484DRAFT_1631347 [Baffinella frigidus]|nr:hypothetical protein T484DRAFT_1631347 [Cryptophyta sp. CCMP2293]
MTARPPAPALRLKGGLGGVDAELVAQLATGLGSMNGAFSALAPEQAAEAYGVKVGGLSQMLMECTGFSLVAQGIFSAKTLAGSSIQEAVAWALVPETVYFVQLVLQGRAAKINMNKSGHFVVIAINLFLAHACFTGADHADTALKVWLAWGAINVVAFIAAPEPALKAWGLSSFTATDVVFMRSHGWNVGGLLAAQASQILWGNSPSTAVGHAFLVMAASVLDGLFISKGPEKLGVPVGALYAWLGISCGVAAFTLL